MYLSSKSPDVMECYGSVQIALQMKVVFVLSQVHETSYCYLITYQKSLVLDF